MDQLRLILLIVGVMVIILIYVWGMRARIKTRLKERRRRAHEPVVVDEQGELPSADTLDRPLGEVGHIAPEGDPFAHQRLVDVEIHPVKRPSAEAAGQPVTAEKADESAAANPANSPLQGRIEAEPAREKESAKEPEKAILLTVMAPAGQPFRGRNILKAAQELDLKLNERGIFDCIADTREEKDNSVFSIANILEPGTFDPDNLEHLSTPGLLVFTLLPGPVDSMATLELMVTTARQLTQRLGGTVCDERRNKLTTQAIMHLKSEVAEFERRRRVWAHQQHRGAPR